MRLVTQEGTGLETIWDNKSKETSLSWHWAARGGLGTAQPRRLGRDLGK